MLQIFNFGKSTSRHDVYPRNLQHSMASYALVNYLFHQFLCFGLYLYHPLYLPGAISSRTCPRISSTSNNWSCSSDRGIYYRLFLVRHFVFVPQDELRKCRKVETWRIWIFGWTTSWRYARVIFDL